MEEEIKQIERNSVDKKENISNLEDQRSGLSSNKIQKILLEMGYELQTINQLIRYFQINSIEIAIEYLSKTNGRWNHPFVYFESDENNLNIETQSCLICNETEPFHRQNIIERPSANTFTFRGNANNKRDIELVNINQYNSINSNKKKSLEGTEAKIINKFCGICLCEIEVEYRLDCQHSFCLGCFSEYLNNKIIDSDIMKIGCPNANCDIFIQENIIKLSVSEEYYLKYLKFKKRMEIQKLENSILCPYPDCDSYGIKEKIEDKNIKCQLGHEFCTECNNPSHEGINCDLKLENDFKKWKDKKHVKKCPKCSFFIEKNAGCNHMTCANKSCNFEFCWICLLEYQPDHYTIPTSSCFKMQFVEEESIFIQSRVARCLRFVFLVIITIIFILICAVFSSIIFSVAACSRPFTEQTVQSLNDRKMKNIYKLILIVTHFLYGLAFVGIGWISILCIIILSPIWGLFYYLLKNYNPYRQFNEELILNEQIDQIQG